MSKLAGGSSSSSSSGIGAGAGAAGEKKHQPQQHILDLNAKNETLWLVKVPKEVAESWATKQSDDLLGSLSINTVMAGPNAPAVKKINVQLSGGMDVEEYTLEDLSSNDRQLLAFKINEQTHSFAIQGQVTKNLVLRPKETKQYRDKVRARSIQATTRQEAQLVTEEEVELKKSTDRTVDFIPPAHAELKRKAQEAQYANKMGRIMAVFDPLELRTKVFDAFNENERCTLKDLKVICKDVPGFLKEKDLKDCLEKYGRYHTKGTYKGYWELKLEFRDHAHQSSAPTSSSSSSSSSST